MRIISSRNRVIKLKRQDGHVTWYRFEDGKRMISFVREYNNNYDANEIEIIIGFNAYSEREQNIVSRLSRDFDSISLKTFRFTCLLSICIQLTEVPIT